MVDEKFSGTLGDFLKKLEAGWGFIEPASCMWLARALREVFPESALSDPAKVEYRKYSTGNDVTFRYHYEWDVLCECVPPRMDLGHNKFLEPIPGGFRVGYTK